MSKRSFLSLLMLTLGLCSCNDSLLPTEEMSLNPIVREDLDGTYPYSQQCVTRGISVPNWESWEKVRLSSGAIATDSVAVPWAKSIVSSNIPSQVRRDIKAENGWMLLKYTVNGNWGANNNYMFFYNKYTGVLKVFYYLSNGAVQSNYGIWHLHINVPQKLFAFTQAIADPINGLYQTQDIYCTNITSTDAKGFVQGWNCFQVELAYDPQFLNGELTVNPVSRTSSDITLTGSYGSSSKGTLITTTTTNPTSGPINGLAKAAGDEALSFIKSEASNMKFAPKILNAAGSIISGGVSAIVKGGINLLFSSFIGRFNKEQSQNYDLQFTTNGTAEFAGTITTEVTGGLVPANLDLSKSALGIRLGVWNLTEQPTLFFDTTAKLLNTDCNKLPRIYHLWKMKGNNMEGIGYNHNYIINPDIYNSLKSRDCKFNYYSTNPYPIEAKSYPQGTIEDLGYKNMTSGSGSIVYENYQEITSFYGKFEVKLPQPSNPYGSEVPRILFLPNGNSGITHNILVKATTTLCVNNSVNDTIVITKTFVPKFEWDPSEYEINKKLYGEYPFTIVKEVY